MTYFFSYLEPVCCGILLNHKKNEIMPLAATWMEIEIIISSEVSQTNTNICYHLYVESKKNDTNEIIYIMETNSQTLKTNLWFPKRKHSGEGYIRILRLTYIYYYI